MNRFLLLLTLLLFSCSLHAQWNGKNAAVVITYDDGYHEQLDNALPVLDSLQLKATFYLSAFFPAVKDRMEEWKQVAANGHELGNHTLYHPCTGNMPGREWVPANNDLSKYSVHQIVNEIRMTNVFLEALDGKKERTFAYTCGDMTIGDTAFIDPLKDEFVAARGVRNELDKLNNIDLYNVNCYVVNNHSADELITWVKQAIEEKALLVILFHGVSGGNSLDVDKEEHKKFLAYIHQNQKDIWVAPMVNVAKFIKESEK